MAHTKRINQGLQRPTTSSINHVAKWVKIVSTLEIKSNYINIDALADFIQRKCNLLLLRANPVPDSGVPGLRAQLQHESNAIISSLRLIFRRDEEFIALTLLRVETCPDCEAILGPVYERFLGGNGGGGAAATVPTNVECYGRLLLCYVRWKQLYRPDDPAGHWERIDRAALATLPYDFPRAIKRKELALKALFPRVTTAGTMGTRAGSNGPSSAKASVTRALLNSRHVRDNIQDMCLRFLVICSDGRVNPGKPVQNPTSARTANEDKDEDDVEIIKMESTSIIVLDSSSEDDNDDNGDKSNPPGATEYTECSKMPIKNGNSASKNPPNYLDTYYDNCFGTTLVANSPPTSLMETVFNTPPPTPTEDDDTPAPEPTPLEVVSTLATGAGKTHQKKLFPLGVSLKISKNFRLHGDRARQNFLTAFRKLSSAKRFHVRLRSEQKDYYLRKHVSNQTVFVEIFCSHEGIGAGIPLQTSRSPTPDAQRDSLVVDSEPFQGPTYANLEGPILQDSPPRMDSRKSRSADDQLLHLITGIEDFPVLSPASLDFAVFGENENRSSLDLLTNYHAPPSSVLDGLLWPGDIFPVLAGGCDAWMDSDFGIPFSALPPPSSVASFV